MCISAAGIDYGESPRNVSIPTSVGPRQTCFEVDINDDNVAEDDEEFLVNLQIQSGLDAQIGAISSTCVRIIDNDGKINRIEKMVQWISFILVKCFGEHYKLQIGCN